jgi:hypothetical protein
MAGYSGIIIKIIYVSVPVTTVMITPGGDNNVVVEIEGQTQIFTCTTGSSRPAAWIQWHIGGQNVTNQVTPQLPQQDGDSLYHLVVWCIQGQMLITTKLSSVKLLILKGDRKLNQQKSLYIYNVCTVSHTM